MTEPVEMVVGELLSDAVEVVAGGGGGDSAVANVIQEGGSHMLTYTASLLTPDSTWFSVLVPLVVVLFLIETMVFGGLVVQARNKHGIPYPTMYAVPGTPRYYDPSMRPSDSDASGNSSKTEYITNEEAYAFNLVQRGHQNMIENAPFFLALLMCAWPYPLYAGIAGLAYVIGRAVYMFGYMRDPKSRIYGAVFIYPGLLTLLGLTGMTAYNVVNGVGPY
jgi:glutathione S-transferase